MNPRRIFGVWRIFRRRLREPVAMGVARVRYVAARIRFAFQWRLGWPYRLWVAHRRGRRPKPDLRAVTPFAVCLHLYHVEQWPSFRKRLERVQGRFRLFVTTADDRVARVRDQISPDFPDASILPCPNRGRDVAPFLRLLRTGMVDGHEVILKLHSKASPHLKRGGTWREDLLDALIGSPHLVDVALAAFLGDPRLGLLGPQNHRMDAPAVWGNNRPAYDALMARMGVDPVSARLDFFQGTMFWVRRAALRRVEALGLTHREFEPEARQLDGTLAHALERAIPAAVRAEGLALADMREVGAALTVRRPHGGLRAGSSKDSAQGLADRRLTFGMTPRNVRTRDVRRISNGAAKTPSVEAVVLTHDGAHHLDGLFASLADHVRYPHFHLTVVDHASSDDTEDVCRRWSDTIRLRRLRAPANFSFAASNNRVASVSEADILFFLNNDVTVESDVVTRAVDALQARDVGVVGFKSLDAEKRVEHIGVRFQDGDARTFFRRPVNARGGGLHDAVLSASPVAVDAVSFAAALLRREEFLELGGFCEDYVYGYEDVDLCLKYALRLSKTIVCLNDVAVRHEVGLTRRLTSKRRDRVQRIANMQNLARRFGPYVRRRERRRLAGDDHERRPHPPTLGVVSHRSENPNGIDALMSDFNDRGWRTVLERRRREVDGASWDLICHVDPSDVVRIERRKAGALEVAVSETAVDDPRVMLWLQSFDAVVGNSRGKAADARRATTNGEETSGAAGILAAATSAEDRGLRIIVKAPRGVRRKTYEHDWGHRVQNLAAGLRAKGHRVRIDGPKNFGRHGLYDADAVIVIRGSSSYEPYEDQISACWMWGDHAADTAELKLYDKVFTTSPKAVDQLAREGVVAMRLFPWIEPPTGGGLQPESAPPNLTDRALILECGGAARRVARRARVPHAVYGGAFRHDPTAAGGFLSLARRRHYDAAARLVVADHAGVDAAGGHLGVRVFEALGAGAVVAAQAHPDIEPLFGDAVLQWRTPDDLRNLFERAGDPDFRADVREKARARLDMLGAEEAAAVLDREIRALHEERMRGPVDPPLQDRRGEEASFAGLASSEDRFGLPKTTRLRPHEYLMRRYAFRSVS